MGADFRWPSDGHWTRASKCNSSTCVEVARMPASVGLRDSERQDEVLRFDLQDWVTFVSRAHLGVSDHDGPLRERRADDAVYVGHRDGVLELSFSARDWDIFLEGVRAGEFDL